MIYTVQTTARPPLYLLMLANQWVVQAAIAGVSEQLIPYDEAFARRFQGTTPGTPLFVNNEVGADYYAVPFNLPGNVPSLSDRPGNTVVVVLIDGGDGSFKEASWAAQPADYLPISKEEALEIAWQTLEETGIDPVYSWKATAELVHLGSTPYYPHWRMPGDGFQILISQDGECTITE